MTPKDVKKISIRLLPDGFSFLNQYVPIQPGADFTQRLEESLLDNLSIPEDEYVISKFSIENTRFCLSPLGTSNLLARQMFEFGLPQSESDETILSLEDASHELRFEFGIDSHLYHFILRNWPDIQFSHPLFDLYRQWVEKNEISLDCMIAEAGDNYLNLLVFKGGQLHFANRFEDTGNSNILYHIMNCWEQSGLDVLDDKLFLSTDNQILRQNLQQYIKQCES